MDAKKCMIVDLEPRGGRQKFITEAVASISVTRNGMWAVRFLSGSRVFNYSRSRLLYLVNPEEIDLNDKGVYIMNKHITDAKHLLRFTDGTHTFYHLTHATGYHEDIEGNKVYVTRTPINKTNGSLWSYLCQLAAETGLVGDNDENLLSKQYELVDLNRDDVPLAQYLGDNSPLKTRHMPRQVYYPFGCNSSQKSAVEAALTHQLSIIQGPPGTGKTQTILNIVANVLMAGKTVLVVSNNNSAIDNIVEKLSSEGLDFIAAKLGSAENKKAFIDNQVAYPDMDGWTIDEEPARAKTKKALDMMSRGFDAQTRQAQLNTERDALLKEAKYEKMLQAKHDDKVVRLSACKSARLMRLLHRYQLLTESGHRPGLWFRLRWACQAGWRAFTLLKENPGIVVSSLETSYYYSRKTEIEEELASTGATLRDLDMTQSTHDLRESSLALLRNEIARHYIASARRIFTIKDLKSRSEEFLEEYPIVLSTTYSSKNCIGKDMVFDYVIMDEASQVDITTGALALSCGLNAVIVGDDKQLPNVVSQEEAMALRVIQHAYNVDERYNAVTHSFLQSCVEVFDDAPVTLLREHYRCHPKIIEFCNKRFYDGELITMTVDHGEDDVLKVIRTVAGNHAREHFNKREIDVIVREVMPQYGGNDSVGIITPYRQQAEEINKALGCNIASTVHKYQGRECDTIVMSMVDNSPTQFSDDGNLLNVAISRAKKRLCIVASGNEMPPDSNLAQLIAYVKYNNFDVSESKLHSVFDLLYKQYTAERLAYEKAHRGVSSQLSENLVYDMLTTAISKLGLTSTEVLCHYPLSNLIGSIMRLDEREKAYVESPFSHVDFLIYNSLTKQPLKAIEVDGWHFHKESEAQQERDNIKDRLLAKCGMQVERISTTATVNLDAIEKMLKF